MSNRLFANLGFLLQIAGILTMLPIGIGFYFNETDAIISLFMVCVVFLCCGFLLNTLCERKDLDFKGSNFLFLVTFILLPLIGSIPYIYLNPFGSVNALDIFTNSYFESISGFTTTGFTFITNAELLPASILIYRSLTELMGGVGIVFLFLVFFQSRVSLDKLSDATGITRVSSSFKKTYLSIFLIYSIYILVFIVIFYVLGFTNLISTGTFVIDTLTGGFQPQASIYQQYIALAPQICILLLMLTGSLNFAFSYNLFAGKFQKMFSAEIVVFFFIILVGAVAVVFTSDVSAFDALFHVISMSSSTGQSYLPFSTFGDTGYAILIVLMLIGGCSFSMAGGMRVSKLISFAKNIKETVISILIMERAIEKPKKKPENDAKVSIEQLSASVSILLLIMVLVIFALLFTTVGVSFTDALFEVGSALTTCGASVGITTVTLPIGAKWLMIMAMTIGRVEILSILLALFSLHKK
jgi:trk system potassium uptake protein TrkH